MFGILHKYWIKLRTNLASLPEQHYCCMFDLNNHVKMLFNYVRVNYHSPDPKIIQQSFAILDHIIRDTYITQPTGRIYFVPLLLSDISLTNDRSLIYTHQLHANPNIISEINTKVKQTVTKYYSESSQWHSYPKSKIINILDKIFSASNPHALTEYLNTLKVMSLVNEEYRYQVDDKAYASQPNTLLIERIFQQRVMVTSDPRIDPRHPNVIYVSPRGDNPTYPRAYPIESLRLLGPYAREPDKMDLSRYFSNITPKYLSISLSQVTSQLDAVRYLCNQLVDSRIRSTIALKYTSGMWGLGTTFALIPTLDEWNNPMTTNQVIFFRDIVSQLLAECLIILWYTQSTNQHAMNLIDKPIGGIDKFEAVCNQIIEDCNNGYIPRRFNSILESINTITILVLELVISDQCPTNQDICWNGIDSFNQSIEHTLGEHSITDCGLTDKKQLYSQMLQRYITTTTDNKMCLQYFHFKSRMFPIISTTPTTMTIYLPPIIANEWLLPFDLDSLFIQYVDKDQQCHQINDSRFVSNKQMGINVQYPHISLRDMSYDNAEKSINRQCTCNQTFFGQSNLVNLGRFISRLIDGYINMCKAMGKSFTNCTYITTIDVIVNNKQLVLLDVNDGGTYGNIYPAAAIVELMQFDTSGLDDGKLYQYKLSNNQCKELNTTYLMRKHI